MSEMPTYQQVLDESEDRPPFANGTEGDAWMSGWCLREGARCKHETADRGECPLMDVVIMDGRTPRQWIDRTPALGPEMYRCTKYEAEQA